MKTLVTTHQLEVFKLFYTHKLHDIFKEDLIVYVDKKDSTEFEKIADLSKTKFYNENDLISYYGETYIEYLRTFKKVYFINMLLEMGEIDDNFYFTDDDVMLFDRMDGMKDLDFIVYDNEVSQMSKVFVESWKVIEEYRVKNMGKINRNFAATNFYIPLNKIPELTIKFKEMFYPFMEMLKKDYDYIEKVCTTTRSARNCNTLVFYLDALFLNTLMSNIFDGSEKSKDVVKPTYRYIRGMKEKTKTTDAKIIWEAFKKKIDTRSKWPKAQPMFHFVVVNKIPLMTEFWNLYNDQEFMYSNINDLLMLNPKERSKILKEEKENAKHLF